MTSALGSVILTANPTTCSRWPRDLLRLARQPALLPQRRAIPHPITPPSGGQHLRRETRQRDSGLRDRRQRQCPRGDGRLPADRTASSRRRGSSTNSSTFSIYPYDKVSPAVTPNGSLYHGQPPYTADNPAPSSYYQANIVVETNRSLQLFSGGPSSPYISTDWNKDGTQHKNSYYNGHFYNMGGCMGCHGSQGQSAKATSA